MEFLTPSRRIAALDGWRGIAILLVLIDHTQWALWAAFPSPWTRTGQHGVTLFFVLSGFLITTKLIEGPIDLKRFYLRRFFRLMPAAWVYLATVWAFGLMMGARLLSLSEIGASLFFYRNYLTTPNAIFSAHFWSLSIEEQFYLVWPSILLLLGVRKARWFAASGALACAGYRFMNWGHYSQWGPNFRTEVRADALLIGCLLALALRDVPHGIASRVSKMLVWPSIVVFCACIGPFRRLPPLVECLAIAVLIAASILHPDAVFARLLSWQPLAWLGTISYSIYVWQEFFFIHRKFPESAIMACLMLVFAIASYYWIERPCTRFGHRITARRADQPTIGGGEPVPARAEVSS